MAHNSSPDLQSLENGSTGNPQPSDTHHQPKSSKTDISNTSLDSALRRYFSKEGEVRLLHAQIEEPDGLSREEQDDVGESGENGPDGNDPRELLKRLQQTQDELRSLREEVERRNLDIEAARWRGDSPIGAPFPEAQPADKTAPARDWVRQYDHQKPVFSIPASRYPVIQAQQHQRAAPIFSGFPAGAQQYNAPGSEIQSQAQYHTAPFADASFPLSRGSATLQSTMPQMPFSGAAFMPQTRGPYLTPEGQLLGGQGLMPAPGAPKWENTDPMSWASSDRVTNLSNGFKSRHALIKIDGRTEVKLREHKARNKPQEFFRVGRVFEALWTEPCSEISIEDSSNFKFRGNYGESLISEIRCFVVIEEFENHCTSVVINSYDGMGVAQRGLTKSDHGIAYTGDGIPFEHPFEYPRGGEAGMQPMPVQVITKKPADFLTPMSRVNYAKLYTIEYGLKVRPFGSIRGDSLVAFIQQYRDVHKSTSARVFRKGKDENAAGAAGAKNP